MKLVLIRVLSVFGALLFFSGCNESTNERASDQIVELSKKVDEMQQEQRLILKEVISLQKKLDSVAVKELQAKRRPESAVEKVNLPNAERLLGEESAEYAMVEFMDYQCPYCIRYAKQVLPSIKQRYVETGKLRYGIRDFPLGFHSKAEGAAIAANCAGKQSQYWPMHDELVANSKSLSADLYDSLAAKLDLSMKDFSSCLADPEMKKTVDADLAYGTEIGTRGTPNFYIGKILGDSIVDVVHISGARSVEAFDRAIQKAMSSAN